MANSSQTTTDDINMLDLRPAKDIACMAATAICQLWKADGKTFWRNTEQRERSDPASTEFFPTVTYRCLNALLRLYEQFDPWMQLNQRQLLTEACIPDVLSVGEAALQQSSLNPSPDKLNIFTLSLYVKFLSKVSKFSHLPGINTEEAIVQLRSASNLLIQYPLFESSYEMSEYTTHPFLLFHAISALNLCTEYVGEMQTISSLSERILAQTRGAAEKLLAKHKLQLLNAGEAIALVFCTSILAIHGDEEDRRYIMPCLDTCFDTQDYSGSWPLGRIIPANKDVGPDRLEISTYEITWAIAETLMALVKRYRARLDEDQAARALNHLKSANEYAQKSIVRLHNGYLPEFGWCTDAPYGKSIIESWTTATVLDAALSYYEVAEEATRQSVIRRFSFVEPQDPSWPSWQRWKKYIDDSEPDSYRPILSYLDGKIVQPIKRNPRQLPSRDDGTVSLLLFGPPGTQKTTICKALADGLGWPVVFLSPGSFIERGLEYIEASSKFVFDNLQLLARAVVIFDECDELFRSRAPEDNTEQTRGITAFVTASMLPKLQELHDRGRVVFCICTNKFDKIDSAIKRGGRIDHIIGVGPPDRLARKRILDSLVANLIGENTPPRHLESAITELAEMTERFIRPELARAAGMLIERANWSSAAKAKRAAQDVKEALVASLTIRSDEFERFEEQKRQFSQAFNTGGPNNA